MSTPLLGTTMTAGHLQFAAAGSWTVAHADLLERLVGDAAFEAAGGPCITIDMANVEELDTLGAWLLERFSRGPNFAGKETRFTGLKPHCTGLMDEMHRVKRQSQTFRAKPNWPLATLNTVGRGTIALIFDMVRFLRLFGELSVAIGRILTHPQQFRLTSTVYHLFRVAWQAVAIMTLISS